MAKTNTALRDRLPHELVPIVISYFRAKKRDAYSMAFAGEYEACVLRLGDNADNTVNYYFNYTNCADILSGACAAGHIEIIRLLLDNDAVDVNYGLKSAFSHRQTHVAQLLIDEGADDWNACMAGACQIGDIAIVNKMIAKGADNWNTCLKDACISGNKGCIDLMVANGANDWTKGLDGACIGGHLDIARDMIARGAVITLWSDPIGLCVSDKLDDERIGVIKLLHANGSRLDNLLNIACDRNELGYVKLAIKLGADPNYRHLSSACKKGHIAIARLLIANGVMHCECSKPLTEH